MVTTRSARAVWLSLTVLFACAPAKEPPTAEPDLPITVVNAGFMTPESVLHDTIADVYLVSNINGSPVEADGNGFISRISPAGEIIDMHWIDGATDGVTLSAPKGMALIGDILYVSDITTIRRFDRTTGAPLGDTPIPGSSFVNDLAPASDGGLWVTDTGVQAGPNGFVSSGTQAVYHVTSGGEIHKLVDGDGLGNPNGIIEVGSTVWVVSFGSGELYRIDGGVKADSLTLPTGGLDGVEAIGGDLLITSWGGSSVLRGPPGGPFHVAVDSVANPADLGIDRRRNRVLIPLFDANEVRIVPLGR